MLRSHIALVGLLAVTLSTASAQVRPAANQAVRAVPIDAVGRRLVVENPAATVSRVWPVADEHADKAPLAAPRAFEIHNRVVLKADSATIAKLAAESGAAATPLGVRGYWQLTTTDVAAAIDLADHARTDPAVRIATVDTAGRFALRAAPSDPAFGLQWHLENTQQPLADVNAEPAWAAGFTGAGVVIGILDSIIETSHPDLAANHLPAGSSNPGGPSASSHGTAVAGIAAAVGNNQLMGAGIAYNAFFTTHVLGSTSDTAAALAFRNDINDIRNNSWGPFDLNILHVPDPVIMDAILEAVTTGRGGRGTVLVWAAGNGGTIGDRVDYDPYASSRYTLAINAIGDQDIFAPYCERGSAVALVTQSDGNDRAIYTTATNNSSTTAFGGTSAAAPLASGVIALLLEARPDLHWRDVRAVLLDTARQCDPADEGWSLNGAGRAIHYRYGFGAIDAGAAIDYARDWQPLSHEITATTGPQTVDQVIPDDDSDGVTVSVDLVDDIIIETVEVVLNVESPYIGDLTVDLISPDGTRAALARRRMSDGADDLVDYVFTSFRQYGERSAGTWQVKIADRASGGISIWEDVEVRVQGQPLCRLDLDRDGLYGLGDLQALLAGFGACSDSPEFDPRSDDDNDGCTGLADLAELLVRFGGTCEG